MVEHSLKAANVIFYELEFNQRVNVLFMERINNSSHLFEILIKILLYLQKLIVHIILLTFSIFLSNIGIFTRYGKCKRCEIADLYVGCAGSK